MRYLALTLLTALMPAATGAQAVNYGRGYASILEVNPVSANAFEVIESHGAGAQDIWCAAASYTERTLGISRGRLYIARARGPAESAPGRKGVVFTTEPTDDAFTSVSVSVRQSGMNLPIFHALQFCRNHIRDLEN